MFPIVKKIYASNKVDLIMMKLFWIICSHHAVAHFDILFFHAGTVHSLHGTWFGCKVANSRHFVQPVLQLLWERVAEVP